MIRRTVLLWLSGFFLAVLAVAFDRHGDALYLNACAICKVKTTLSGTSGTSEIQRVPAAVASRAVTAAFALRAPVTHESRALSPVSQMTSVWPSRAPPFSS